MASMTADDATMPNLFLFDDEESFSLTITSGMIKSSLSNNTSDDFADAIVGAQNDDLHTPGTIGDVRTGVTGDLSKELVVRKVRTNVEPSHGTNLVQTDRAETNVHHALPNKSI